MLKNEITSYTHIVTKIISTFLFRCVVYLKLICSAIPGGQSSQYSPEQFFLHLHVNPIPSAEGMQTPRLTQGLGLQGSKSVSKKILT